METTRIDSAIDRVRGPPPPPPPQQQQHRQQQRQQHPSFSTTLPSPASFSPGVASASTLSSLSSSSSSTHSPSHTALEDQTGSPSPLRPPASFTHLQGLKRRWSCEACRRRKLKCDGNRPSCYFCSSRKLDCVYVGTRVRAEYDMERQNRMEKERQEAARAKEEAAPARAISMATAPPGTLRTDCADQPFLQRPGAPEHEEMDLVQKFFERAPWISGVIHKRTYLLSFKTLPSFLRYAVCAAGAGTLPVTQPTQEVTEWYVQQAIEGLEVALRDPTVECMQALLVLPPTSTCSPSAYHSEQLKKLRFEGRSPEAQYRPRLPS
ncbi:hypothetical protein DFJ73DRAFT_240283 [Zopfochytrium polystomum]|nr:hypothetical protein DFJ73DRAFT_240283 [Zopfochytrium polystomum]